MSRKRNSAVQVMVRLNISDRNGLKKIAEDWDLSPADIVHRMARMLITEKITVDELFQKQDSQIIADRNICDYDFPIRFSLTANDKARLSSLADTWGFSTSQLLRRFIRALIAGDIPRLRLWESG